VITVGFGTTGTSVARTLLMDETAAGSNARTVLLEAREVCSGATGRNGGHCLETAEVYLALRNELGSDAAQRISKFRLKHLNMFIAVAEAHGIVEETEFRKV
jgi:glycine/D-amino acid oxidase-like deaminating enzyme